MPRLQVNARRPGRVWHLRCWGEPPLGQGGGDVGLGSAQTTRGIAFELGDRAHRSRQRAAVVGRRGDRRLGGPPPRFGPMVQRHRSHRSLRRGPDERRRFCSARRRDQLRHRAGARRSGPARRRQRHRRTRGQCDPQGRSPAAPRRGQCRAPGHSRVHDKPRQRQPRDCARASLHPRGRQSIALGVRALRQYSSVQSAEDAGQSRGPPGERPRCRRRRARRRGLVLDPRSQYGLAAGEDRRGGTARRGARTRA